MTGIPPAARPFARACAALCFSLLAATAPALAQQRDTTQRRQQTPDSAEIRRMVQQRFGRTVTNAELLERLRESGLTRAQVRARLQQLGYDPGLADRYFDMLDRGLEPQTGNAPEDFLRALARVGVVMPGLDTMTPDSLLPDSLRMDSLRLDSLAFEEEDELRVFGVRFFRDAGSQFDPVVFGPVDPGYRLGPGDEVMLVLTGDVEDAYRLEVTRDGMIFIPDVGQVSVNGLTLGQLENALFTRLGRVYSGVGRGPEATTQFSVSLGRLRMNQVYVMGEVALPGAYQVSAAATVFNALYRAGGPKETGTFRNIEVVRSDGERFVVDAYDYLLTGSSPTDVRLEHGDRIYVPPAGSQVTVQGAVRRPAIYEVKPGEGIRTALAFAGGLEPDALVQRIQIDRILPPAEREPGRTRVLRDIDIAALSQAGDDASLEDGDIVLVFTVSGELRSRVWITGDVREPGLYEWSPGSTLRSLIERADGLGETAYTPRALIYRLNEQDRTRRVMRASLTAVEGQPAQDVALLDGDSVVVLSREQLTNQALVSIEGFVKRPGEYVLAEGMTLKDLILEAGGFTPGAFVLQAEVSRMPNPLQRTDTTALILRVPLEPEGDAAQSPNGEGDVPIWLPDSLDVALAHGDRVFVRRAPGYIGMREVSITGEVVVPGRYVLRTREENFTDLIRRAGGVTQQAYVPGIHVVREGRVVAADLQRALQDPRDPNNIELQAGDSLHVPLYDPTVVVTGAVNFEARVLYREGRGLDYYIDQAGGYTDVADKRQVTITYPNGERAAVGRFLVVSRPPRVQPGSLIFVPAVPETERNGFDWDQFLTRTLTVLSTTATLLIAISQLN